MDRKPRAAGLRFERKIATALRGWLGEGWEVSRNQTDRQKGQTGEAGEFKIVGPWAGYDFPWTIECKTGYGFEIRQLFKATIKGPVASTPTAEGFWAQAVRQAETIPGQRPMLIFTSGKPGDAVLVAVRRYGLNAVYRPDAHDCRLQIIVEGDRLDVYRWANLMERGSVGGLMELAVAPVPPPITR